MACNIWEGTNLTLLLWIRPSAKDPDCDDVLAGQIIAHLPEYPLAQISHGLHWVSSLYLHGGKQAQNRFDFRISTDNIIYLQHQESVPRPKIANVIDLHIPHMQQNNNGFSWLAVNRQAISWITWQMRDISGLTAMCQFPVRRGEGDPGHLFWNLPARLTETITSFSESKVQRVYRRFLADRR
jgi:hypothetical protein